MLAIAKADREFTDAGTDLTDADGNISRLSLRMWELPEDAYSAFVRHPAIVGPLQQLHGPMYHFHHKMMLKEPRTGGAWEWHQVRRTLPPSPGAWGPALTSRPRRTLVIGTSRVTCGATSRAA